MKKILFVFSLLLTILSINLLIIALLAPTLLGYFVAKVTQAVFGMSFFIPQIVIVHFPQNTTYVGGNLPLNYSVYNLSAVEMYYKLDNGGRINLSGNTTFFIGDSGQHAVTVYADDKMGNITATGVLFFVNLQQGPPGSAGTGGGGGGGGAGFAQPRNFTVDKNALTLDIHQGETKTARVTITNTGGQALTLKRTYRNLDNFITPETYSLYERQGEYEVLSVRPGERQESFALAIGDKETIELVFNAAEKEKPGNYVGVIVIESGAIIRQIPVSINVLPAVPLFNITVDIAEESRRLVAGNQLVAEINIINLRQGRANVNISYQIKDINGRLLYQIEENTTIEGQISFLISETRGAERQISFLRATNISAELDPGDYILAVVMSYEDTVVSVDSDVFQVVLLALPRGELPYAAVGIIANILAVFLIILIVIWAGYKTYRLVLLKTAPYRYYKQFGFLKKHRKDTDLIEDFS